MAKRIERNLRIHMSFIKYGELDSGAEVEVVIQGKKEIIIGRSKKHATISVNDESVSRAHFCFTKEDNGLFVQDLKTKNGTKLNDRQVSLEPEVVSEGDTIRAGDHAIVIKKIEKIDPKEELDAVVKVQHRNDEVTRSFK